MKKIFAISFLSLMAVTGGARAEVEQYNLNLATAEYVEGIKDMLEEEIYNSVPISSVAESGDTVAEDRKDRYIPTVARMEAAIANDTSGLVEKAQVVKSDDKALSDGTTDLSSANADEIVPTVANVEANFAPRIGDAVYSGTPGGTASTVGEIGVTNLPRGEYSVIVSVDDSGNVSFRWVPIQIGSCDTTDGGTCGPE